MRLIQITCMTLALLAASSTATAWDGRDGVPGHAVKIVGDGQAPWALNRRGDIFQWTGYRWTRMPGSATDIGDGWVIGTDRRSGGYGIYRWNGRSWRRTSGGAIAIGGSYERPWVINNRNERFVWNGRDWSRGYDRGYSQSLRSRGDRIHQDRARERSYGRNNDDGFARGYDRNRHANRNRGQRRRSDW